MSGGCWTRPVDIPVNQSLYICILGDLQSTIDNKIKIDK